MSINFLKLLHFADSAFPIGAASHSFGMETLTAEGQLTAPQIEQFLTDLLWESGKIEAVICRMAHRYAHIACHSDAGHSNTGHSNTDQLNSDEQILYWWQLNQRFAALKGARESRSASATLGRRFLQGVAHLEQSLPLQRLYQQTVRAAVEIHYCAAFGLVGGALALAEDETVLAYLQQTTMGMVSACQRLLPVGQGRAGEILWNLKPVLAAVAQAGAEQLLPLGSDSLPDLRRAFANLSTFTPLVDLGSMRHPTLPTRLFIS